MCGHVSRAFANTKTFLINITIGNVRNDPNYPHLTNHKINWKLKRQTQKIIVTICRNLHCQSHSQQPDLNLPTWLRLSNEEEFWCINLTSIPIWFWGYKERERYWRFLVKFREITLDESSWSESSHLWVVEFREKEKNKEDQGEEVRGCGLCGWTCGGK